MKIFLATLAVSTLVLIACTMDEDPYTKIKFRKRIGSRWLQTSRQSFQQFKKLRPVQ